MLIYRAIGSLNQALICGCKHIAFVIIILGCSLPNRPHQYHIKIVHQSIFFARVYRSLFGLPSLWMTVEDCFQTDQLRPLLTQTT
jgi:hypothetical protein